MLPGIFILLCVCAIGVAGNIWDGANWLDTPKNITTCQGSDVIMRWSFHTRGDVKITDIGIEKRNSFTDLPYKHNKPIEKQHDVVVQLQNVTTVDAGIYDIFVILASDSNRYLHHFVLVDIRSSQEKSCQNSNVAPFVDVQDKTNTQQNNSSDVEDVKARQIVTVVTRTQAISLPVDLDVLISGTDNSVGAAAAVMINETKQDEATQTSNIVRIIVPTVVIASLIILSVSMALIIRKCRLQKSKRKSKAVGSTEERRSLGGHGDA